MIWSDSDHSLDWNRSMVNREENDLPEKRCFNGRQFEQGFQSLHTLIQHGYTFYWNDVCIQPGDKKTKTQQIKLLFNDYRISSCVNFEYLPLNTLLQCFSKALLHWIVEQISHNRVTFKNSNIRTIPHCPCIWAYLRVYGFESRHGMRCSILCHTLTPGSKFHLSLLPIRLLYRILGMTQLLRWSTTNSSKIRKGWTYLN